MLISAQRMPLTLLGLKWIVLLLQVKIILMTSSSIAFPVTFHQYKLSTNDSKPFTITGSIPFCIGTPFQCFEMIVDSMTSTSWINDEHHKYFFNNSFSRADSSSYEEVENTFSLLFSGAYCSGFYIKDIVSPLDKVKSKSAETIKMPIGLVNASEIKEKVVTRDGTLGITKSFFFDNKRLVSYNYLDYLKNNSLITERIVSFEYNDLVKGTITFGAPPKALKTTCGKDVKYPSNSWACYVASFSFGKEKIDTPHEVVMFDSVHQNVVAPYEGGFFLVNKFLKQSNGHCNIEAERDDSVFYLLCDLETDISAFEDIKFSLGEAKFTVYARDLFVLLPSMTGYVSLFKVKRNEKYTWTFGIPAFKHKLIALNQDERIIGFKDYRASQGGSWLFVVVSLFIIEIVISILIYIRRKRRMNRPQTEIDFSLVK